MTSDFDTNLAALLDTLIPPSRDGRLPGAGAAGVADYIEEKASELRPLLEEGLAALDRLAGERGAAGFAALDAADRAEVLKAYAEQVPAFVPGLLFHTYVGYYQQGPVVEGLGLEDRPPFPEGYVVEPTDLEALLGDMRDRPKLFRE